MKIIDGSQGEGGGQIFRTSLTLSLCTGEPVTIKNIRAGRKKPGLLRQHLTCLSAAQAISDASIEGAELGSMKVVFRPQKVKAGSYRFSVGSAGSSTLVFQTIYLPLLLVGEQSELVLEGGTHNGMAPSFDFIRQSFLPELKKMGALIEASLDRYGFYPAGGGAWRATIGAAKNISPYTKIKRGEIISVAATATSAQIPGHVVTRELQCVSSHFNLPKENLHKRLVRSIGPGNILSVQVESKSVVEMVEVVGERGVSAESVVDKVIAEVNRYLASNAVIGEHLADQLLLPMALGGGGSFTTLTPSLHLTTNAAVISEFTRAQVAISQLDDRRWRVVVSV